MESDKENSSVTLSLSKAIGEGTQQLRDRSNSKSSEDGRNKQELDSLFVLQEHLIAMMKVGNLMNDGRTVGDGPKKNSSDYVHTTKASGRATKVGESNWTWESKVRTR